MPQVGDKVAPTRSEMVYESLKSIPEEKNSISMFLAQISFDSVCALIPYLALTGQCVIHHSILLRMSLCSG
jgi:hypothetical protein